MTTVLPLRMKPAALPLARAWRVLRSQRLQRPSSPASLPAVMRHTVRGWRALRAPAREGPAAARSRRRAWRSCLGARSPGCRRARWPIRKWLLHARHAASSALDSAQAEDPTEVGGVPRPHRMMSVDTVG